MIALLNSALNTWASFKEGGKLEKIQYDAGKENPVTVAALQKLGEKLSKEVQDAYSLAITSGGDDFTKTVMEQIKLRHKYGIPDEDMKTEIGNLFKKKLNSRVPFMNPASGNVNAANVNPPPKVFDEPVVPKTSEQEIKDALAKEKADKAPAPVVKKNAGLGNKNSKVLKKVIKPKANAPVLQPSTKGR